MDPRVGLPLHFTVEAIGLATAGVIVTWAVLTKRWTSAIGGGSLVVAQVLYAGQFVGAGGGAVAGLLRLAGAGLVAFGAWNEPDRPLLIGGAAGVAAGSLWRMASDPGPALLGLGPRLVLAAGLAALAVWAWRRATGSVRTRIVGAFLGIVAVAVVVSGGAAARIGVTDSVSDVQRRLDELVEAEQRRYAEETDGMLSRAALASAIVTQEGASRKTIDDLRTQTFPDLDVVLYVEGTKVVLSSGPDAPPIDTLQASVAGAGEGRPATSIAALSGDEAEVVAATPVFRKGPGRSPADVAGVLAVARRIDPRQIAQRSVKGTVVQLVTADGLLAGSGRGPVVPFRSLGSRDFASGDVSLSGERYVGSMARLRTTEPPETALALAVPLAVATDVAAGFPRALVGGVLAAALLAVVIALWLSARLTRPIVALADEAERVKSEFLSTVSHELRTPLTPIRGYADLLRRERLPRGRATTFLDEIDVAAQRLERIVSLLVEVAAMQAGRLSVDRQPVDVAPLLADVARAWKRKSERHEFSVKVPRSLPQVEADPRALHNVLDELMDNAVKFSPEGGPIELRARRTNEGIEFTVKDDGIGMELEAVDRLASAFVQGDTSGTRRFGGLGLGLTYVAGVLTAHGSRLRVTAAPAGGASFSFVLPAVGMVARMQERVRST